jgi:hypothetical protein
MPNVKSEAIEASPRRDASREGTDLVVGVGARRLDAEASQVGLETGDRIRLVPKIAVPEARLGEFRRICKLLTPGRKPTWNHRSF